MRRQEQDSATVFEIIGQVNAMAMNAEALLKYLLRTIMGRFMVPKLMVLRRESLENGGYALAASLGVQDGLASIESEGTLAAFAQSAGHPFDLADPAVEASEEAARLRALGMVSCVPLVQQAASGQPVQLEGLLLLGERLVGGAVDACDRRMLGLIGQAVAITFRNELLYRRSIVDDLTGVSSRGHFEAQLGQEIGRVRRYGGRSLSLVMIDLDHFKKVNDKFGHPAGDEVLRSVARIFKEAVRAVDMVARYGGEEFAIILIEIDRPSATEVADRLRAALEAMAVNHDGRRIRITASFGVSCFPDDAEDKRALVKAADQALYRAKAEGRNRVCTAQPLSAVRPADAGSGGERKDGA
jgi:diguanylate cyclase (GGDEF)-like protein